MNPIAAPKRPRAPVERLLSAHDEAPRRRPVSPQVAYTQLVDAHSHLLSDWAARRALRAAANGGDIAREVDPKDALQYAHMALWRDFPRLPKDPAERTKWIRKALAEGAMRALRSQLGRHRTTDTARAQGAGPYIRTYAFDFTAVEQPDPHQRDPLAKEIGRNIGIEHAIQPSDEILARHSVIGLLALLTPEEAVVMHRSAEGLSAQQIAQEIGLSAAQVRQRKHEARWLLETIIAHSEGRALDCDQRRRLDAVLAEDPKDQRTKRIAERHRRACSACKRRQDLRERAESDLPAILPLPLLALGGITHVAAALNAAHTAAAAATSGGLSLPSANGLIGHLAANAGAKTALLASTGVIATGSLLAGTLASTQLGRHPGAPGALAAAATVAAPGANATRVAAITTTHPIARVSRPILRRRARTVRHPHRRPRTRVAHTTVAPITRPHTPISAPASVHRPQPTYTTPAAPSSTSSGAGSAPRGGGLAFGH